MQQKYIWCGALLIVVVASAAYITVDRMVRDPNSMLARYGAVATFAGLNPNPLCDVNRAITASPAVEQGEPGIIMFEVPKPEKTNTTGIYGELPMETIEPIQVEIVPPPSPEPLISLEESELPRTGTPTSERSGFDFGEPPVEKAPKPMPYADADDVSKATTDTTTRTIKAIRVLGVEMLFDDLYRALSDANSNANAKCRCTETQNGGCKLGECCPKQALKPVDDRFDRSIRTVCVPTFVIVHH